MGTQSIRKLGIAYILSGLSLRRFFYSVLVSVTSKPIKSVAFLAYSGNFFFDLFSEGLECVFEFVDVLF